MKNKQLEAVLDGESLIHYLARLKTEKCKKHPKYTGMRKPRCTCLACWRIYNGRK